MKNRPFFWVCLCLSLLLMLAAAVEDGEYLTGFPSSGLQGGEQVTILGKVEKKVQKDSYQMIYLNQNHIFYQQHSLQESKVIIYIFNQIEEMQKPRVTGRDMMGQDMAGQEAVQIGEWIKARGKLKIPSKARNPGNFDQRQYYKIQGIRYFLYADCYEPVSGVKEGIYDGLREKLYRFRKNWESLLYETVGEKYGGILSAILLGEKSGMDADVKELYQKNGVGHILAISGLHLSFIGVGLYQILRRMTGSYSVGGVFGILFLMLYILMIGFTVSAVRALVMFLFRVGADVAGRKYDSLTAFAAALLIVLIWKPLVVYDGGFWLSFGAVLAVILILPIFKEFPVQGFWASVSIHLMIFPILMYYFYEFPVYSAILNLLVIPLMSVLLFFGIFGSLLCVVLASTNILIMIGAGMLKICTAILWIYEKCCERIPLIPGARIVTGQPEFWQIAVYYLLLSAAVWVWHCCRRRMSEEKNQDRNRNQNKNRQRDLKDKRRCAYAVLFVCLGSVLLTSRFGERGCLSITVLDVGQGDGIFMRGPQGVTYFIDGGSSNVKRVGRYRIEPFLKSQGVEKLDYVFISHGDSDHMNGISEMLERQETDIEIGTLVLPVQIVWEDGLKELAANAAGHGVKVVVIEPGQALAEGSLHIACIQPGEDYMGGKGNAASMVLVVTYGEFDMLFTGDVEGESEEALTDILKERYAGRKWEVLKAAHHGSKNSSSEEFLETVKPMYAMISAGQGNRYGHPHEETIERLEAAGSRIYSTQECGAVGIEVKGEGMRIWRYLRERDIAVLKAYRRFLN